MDDTVNPQYFADNKIRQRRQKTNTQQSTNISTGEKNSDFKKKANHDGETLDTTIANGSFWLTRIVILRYLGFIYFVAFLVALHQNKQLIGKDGLLPADKYLNDVKKQTDGTYQSLFTTLPSILWLFDYEGNLDVILDYIAYVGLGLSAFLLLWGGANWFIMLTLWILYHSLVNVGQRWYGFGWESQLLETGFLVTFLCPLLSLSPLPKSTPTSKIVLWAHRWLIFRIMIGAGLIKIRGDKCWRDLTCMNYHYETQPVPNPMAYFMHQSPEPWHKFETLSNHFVELVAPFLLLLPLRVPAMIGGVIQIVFQTVLIISGNLSFLNWLTILPSLACFDDRSFEWMFSSTTKQMVVQLQTEGKKDRRLKAGNYIRRVWNIMFGILIAYLSIPVVQNLLSSRQHMNTSFDPLRLVNTYGAFGSVTKERTEVIYQGTNGDPANPATEWLEYEFKCKPGRITRRPCLISPYHYRLDWLLWFAAFQSYQHNPWMITLAAKLLANDNQTTSLIEHNPFINTDPPQFIRVQHYRYKFTKVWSKDASAGRWWKRHLVGEYLPPVSLDSLKSVLKRMNVNVPKVKRKKRKTE